MSTSCLYESSRVLESFRVFQKFNLKEKPQWLMFKFPKDFDFIDKLIANPPFESNSSLGSVLASSFDSTIFDIPYLLRKRVERMRRSRAYPATGDNTATEVKNYWEPLVIPLNKDHPDFKNYRRV